MTIQNLEHSLQKNLKRSLKTKMSYFFPSKKKEETNPYQEQENKVKEEKYVITAVQMEEPKKEEGYSFE